MDSSLLASLATFKSLQDEKHDIYHVIGEFIKDIFLENGISMTSIDIKNKLKESYGFVIPDAVIKTALKKIGARKEDSKWQLEKGETAQSGKEIKEYFSFDFNELIVSIYGFIREKDEKILITKEEIVNSLSLYIKDEYEQDDEIIKYIASFIIQKQSCGKFNRILSQARDGYILLMGLNYQLNYNELYSFKNDLTLILDTELLFSAAGYNGELYKDIFINDFIALVENVNKVNKSKNNKNRVYLRYLNKTEREINNFFRAAEEIVKEDKIVNRNSAMEAILNGCRSSSDVIEKKAKFFNFLRKQKIEKLDSKDISISENTNHIFNLDSEGLRNSLKKEGYEDNEINDHIETLNIINILRKGHSKDSLENVKYIFLTATRNLTKIAWRDEIKKNDEVPLVSSLGFMIDRFWFKLQKPLNDDSRPISFQVATKARIILSGLFKEDIAFKLKDIESRKKSGKLEEEDALSAITMIRQIKYDNPDNIKSDSDVDEALSWLSENAIDDKIKELSHIKSESERLRHENDNKEQEIIKLRIENNFYKDQEEKKEYWKRKIFYIFKILFFTIFSSILLFFSYKSYKYKEIVGYISGLMSLLIIVWTGLNKFSKKIIQ